MKIAAGKFGLSVAGAFAVIWIICSLFVWLLPQQAMQMRGPLMHENIAGMAWNINLVGFLFGLVLWPAMAGFTAWLAATFYNRF